MGYSVKWVVENLGITRDMLRYYEKESSFLPTRVVIQRINIVITVMRTSKGYGASNCL